MQYENKNIINPFRLFILFLMQAVSLISFSQTASPAFSHLTTADGLSQSGVFAILKDYKGYMWFGTDEGLNRYDGYKFSVYKYDPEKPGSISGNSIYGLLEDAAHNLWVVSAGGLDRFDRTKESFIHYNINNKILFRNIFQDSKKRIWLGSIEGFCLYDPEKRKIKFYKHTAGDSNSLSNNYVYKITEDNYGELWIATRNGLNRFNPETEKFVHYNNDPQNRKSIGSGYIKTVYKDSKGIIWAGTQGSGIGRFNRSDNSFTNFKNNPADKNSIGYNDILSFREDSNGELWIGTENGGISVLNYSKNTFQTYKNDENDPYSISGNSVYSLYKDDIGNMWAGTWSGGINFHAASGAKFKHYRKIPNNSNSLSNNLVLSIGSDRDNHIWIGTDGGGLNRFDPQTNVFTNYRKNIPGRHIYNDYVLSGTEYLPGMLAVGFHRGGIDLLDIKKEVFTHYVPGGVNLLRQTSPSINIVYKDRQNQLWLGTNDNGGIYLFDYNTKEFTNFFPDPKNGKSINGSTIFVMYETLQGEFWIGGDKGLDLFDRKTNNFVHHQHDPNNKRSLSNNSVYAILEDHTGNLWLGTAGGLNFYDIKANAFTAYTEKDGLPNNTIWAIQQDPKGNLWLSTNKGLSKFNPSAKTFRNYTTSDGLQSNTFKLKASYQSPAGEMFFGGVNGFNSFYPDSIKDNDFIPPVYLTDFQIFNKTLGIGGSSPLKQAPDEAKEITLFHHQSVFSIGFAALNFTQPERNMYAYKLEGFDKDWTYAGNKRSATYTNLDPGTYTFKVKGSNNDGVWNEAATSVKITILPPFWLTWWFMVGIFLLISGSVVGFYRIHMNRIKKQKLLLEQKVYQQTIQLVNLNEEERKARMEAEQARMESEKARQEAGFANEELEIKNKELEQFAYVASHDLQEPLRTTAGFAELLQQQYRGKIDEKADKYLAFISEATSRMKVLIKDLLDFSRIGPKAPMEKVDCNHLLKYLFKDIMAAIQEAGADIQFTELPVINGYPTEIKLLFQNLVINAIKFRRKDIIPQIRINAQETAEYWEFSVSDNGIGIEKKNCERIFDIFQRLHTRVEYEGSGIGLAHCKKIVELHKGKIWVNSKPGEGTTFHFTILKNKAEINL
ncbi:MAG: two-component regulator propeller domain-containing protein [Ferruginibacter sp.]